MTTNTNGSPRTPFNLTDALRAHFKARETAMLTPKVADYIRANWSTSGEEAVDDAIAG